MLNSLALDWGSSAPAGLSSADFWAARLTFVLLAPISGNYTIAVTVDDLASVQVDGEVLLTPGGPRRTSLQLGRGYHDVEVYYLEGGGAANLRLTWDAGVANAVSDKLTTCCQTPGLVSDLPRRHACSQRSLSSGEANIVMVT